MFDSGNVQFDTNPLSTGLDSFLLPDSRSLNSSRVSPLQSFNRFSPTVGYGLVDANAAVSRSLNQSLFRDVPNLGRNSWNLDLIKAPEVWAKGYTGQGVTVAVIDTGVDIKHPDLVQNIWRNVGEIPGNGIDDDRNGFVDDVHGWNFPDNNGDVLDRDGHGTHVAGIIGASQNTLGNTGVAPNVKIMPIKVIGGDRIGTTWDLAQGIRYAVDNGAKVINISLGGSSPMGSVQSAIRYASQRGSLVVAAAGNSRGSLPIFPAQYALTDGIAVGAVDRQRRFAGFSNRAGTNPSMAYTTAPGTGVVSTLPNRRYGGMSGTSMSAPHVAGVAALIYSARPEKSVNAVRSILVHTSNGSVR